MLILLGLTLLQLVLSAQNIKNKEKIDPKLGDVINAEKADNSNGSRSSTARSQTKGKINKLQNQPHPRLHECIVYTTDAQALKDKGITVHSILPKFITAMVSVKQIEQMAAMKQVTYIELSKTNFPTQRNSNNLPSKN